MPYGYGYTYGYFAGGKTASSPLSISAPNFTALTSAQPYDFSVANSNEVTASDADAGGGDFTFTIDATGDGTPTITLATTTGLVFATGDGTADEIMEFDCTVAEFIAAMDGATLQGGTDGSVSIAYTMTDGTNSASRTQTATLTASAGTVGEPIGLLLALTKAA